MTVICLTGEGADDGGAAFPEPQCLWYCEDPEGEVTSCILGALSVKRSTEAAIFHTVGWALDPIGRGRPVQELLMYRKRWRGFL